MPYFTDIDECQSPDICPLAACINSEGSYSCMTCDSGYKVSSDRHTCEGRDLCVSVFMLKTAWNLSAKYLMSKTYSPNPFP